MCRDLRGFLKAFAGSLAAIIVVCTIALLCGCKSTGSRIVVGEQYILPEVSDAADNFSAKFYEDIKGASVWTCRDSEVRVDYFCAYTNTYLGVFHTQSEMRLGVTVTPLATSP